MKICAIDIHHHYVPSGLLEEAKKHGKALGVELKETNGERSLAFGGGPPFVLHPELPAVDERLKMMQDSKLATAALEGSLVIGSQSYPLFAQPLDVVEAWADGFERVWRRLHS